MGVPQTPGTPVTFEQINDDLNITPVQSTLDLETAGQLFGLDLDPVNWSDGEVGLSMDEFRGGAVATTAAITLTTPSVYSFVSPVAEFRQPQAVGNPNPSPAVNPSPGYITAGPHSFNFGVTADGNYVVYNALNVPPATISPASGIDGAPPANNIHTVTLPALPYSWESPTTIPTSPYSPFHNSSTMYNGFGIIQDRFPTPTAPANALAPFAIRRMYNDKYLAKTEFTVPATAGTYEVAWVDWRWGIQGEWSLSTAKPPANPLPATAPWVTGTTKGVGGTQPFTSNFYRQPVRVTVTANPSPTQTRTTQVFAFLPTAFNPTPLGTQMNRNGSPTNPTNYYYPITVTQAVNPTAAPTMTITPSAIALDYSGGGKSVTLNVTPNAKTYSVSIVAPAPLAPNFSFTPNSSPKTGDATITVGATAYSGASARSAILRTIIPAPNPADIITTDATITQTGIDLKVGGFAAPGGTTINNIPHEAQAFSPRAIVTNAPPNTPWTVTKSSWVTIPAPLLSGTGPSPTFGYTVTANPSASSRSGNVTVDFDVDGTPYKTIFTLNQDATPFNPEFSISPVNSTIEFTDGTSTNQPKNIEIQTNQPFTITYTGDTTLIKRIATPTVPATETSFSATLGPPVPFVFNFNTPTANNDYVIRTTTFKATSPVTSPTAPTGVYTKTLQLARNIGFAYLNFKWPPTGTVTGWSYSTNPTPQGGRLSMPGAGGAASLQVDAHPNLTWTLSVQQPHPDINVGSNFNGAPIGSALSNQTGPKTWTLPSIPAGPPSGQYSYLFTLADNMSDVTLVGTGINDTPRRVGMTISTAIPEIVSSLTISPDSISPPSAGATNSISATGNAPFTKSVPAPQAPWLSVDPAAAQTAGPSTTFNVITQANASSSARSGTVFISSPAGDKTVSVTQAGAPVTPTFYSVDLVANRTSGADACTAYPTSFQTTYYIDNSGFNAASGLYTRSLSGTYNLVTTSGYFTDGNVWRYWNGTLGEFGLDGTCAGGNQ